MKYNTIISFVINFNLILYGFYFLSQKFGLAPTGIIITAVLTTIIKKFVNRINFVGDRSTHIGMGLLISAILIYGSVALAHFLIKAVSDFG